MTAGTVGTDRLGIGYQYGTQTTTYFGMDFDVKTRFVRIAIGGGVKL